MAMLDDEICGVYCTWTSMVGPKVIALLANLVVFPLEGRGIELLGIRNPATKSISSTTGTTSQGIILSCAKVEAPYIPL